MSSRQPDALYSSDGYCDSTWMLIDPIRRKAMDSLHAEHARGKVETARVTELEREVAAQADAIGPMSPLLDVYARRLAKSEAVAAIPT